MDNIKKIIAKVRETLSQYNLINPGDLVIVALSGGADSVCLLDILYRLKDELKIKLIAAHYNHGLRPAEDDAETLFASKSAASMNLPFETEKAFPAITGIAGSIEERARDVRYRFLDKIKNKHRAHKIAMGHNLNDQAETVIMRVLRGSGSSGLAGIPPFRDNTIIRPLIRIRRDEIETYLKNHELSFITDSSNLEPKYFRNRIRLEILPLMLKYQPRLIENLGQLSELLRGESDYLASVAENWIKEEAERRDDNEILIPVSSFIKLDPPVRNLVTRQALSGIRKGLRRIEKVHIESVSRLACGKRPQAIINLPGGLIVKKIYDRLIFSTSGGKKMRGFHYSLKGPGKFFLKRINRWICIKEIREGVDLDGTLPPDTAYIDSGRISFPLLARNSKPGDRFIPLGMNGSKKIKDFFIDQKIPSETRSRIPILVNGDMPVWVCGYRIDDRFKVTTSTKNILKVTVTLKP